MDSYRVHAPGPDLPRSALSEAQQHLEQALTLAKEIGASIIIDGITAFLASTYIAQNKLIEAEAVLNNACSPDTPMQTQMQRLDQCASAELALAHNRSDEALEIVDHVIASAAHMEHGTGVVPFLWHLRAKGLAALDRRAEAESVLQAAQTVARRQGSRSILWRICATLGSVYRAQGHGEQAEEAFAEARAIIEELAANVPDEALRDNFLRGAATGIQGRHHCGLPSKHSNHSK